jgi:predicted Zn-dependent protease
VHREQLINFWLAVFGILLTLSGIFVLQNYFVISKIVDNIPTKFDTTIGKEAFKYIKPQLLEPDNKELQKQLFLAITSLFPSATDGTFQYRIYIEKNNQVNAYALPGGIIVLNSGLVHAAQSSEEILAVVAHEISHIQYRHHVKNLVHRSTIYAISSIIFWEATNVALLKEGSSFLMSMHYSREQELEADREALKILTTAGISADGMISFFSRLIQNESSADFAILSTHPNTETRIQKIKEIAKAYPVQSSRHIKFDITRLKAAISGQKLLIEPS